MFLLGVASVNETEHQAAGNDKDFRTSLKDFESFVERLSELIMERDPTIPELPKKDIVRILHQKAGLS
jgi:Conserved hypothetical protein (DUF2461)